MKNFTRLLLLSFIAMISLNASAQVPKLNSLPSATATMYLDFDGHTVKSYAWNNNVSFVCATSGLTADQITEIFHRVSEDYRPFNINITTDSTKYIAAPLANRMRLIVTPTSGWYQGVGGVSYIGSFTWGDDVPGFVFTDRLNNNPKYIAECVTHEGGHTVGLSHQSTYDANCNLTETYAMGTGTGTTSWAPVMGNSYYRNMTGWNDGPTPYGCSLTQDNLTIITTSNGFGYRTDDYTEELGTSTFNIGTNNFTGEGIITTGTDKDAFKFTISQNSNFHLDVNPFGINSSEEAANLDVMVKLYNSSKVLINTFNPSDALKVSIDTTLNAGTYYYVVSGSGNANSTGYGSLGSYSMRGTTGVLPIKDIRLSGQINNNQHELKWKIVTDDAIKNQWIQVSEDGLEFKNLMSLSPSNNSFTYTPQQQNTTLYYRLKAISVINQTAYSNILALKSGNAKQKQFEVTTLVQSQINMNAPDAFQYKILDANGRTIQVGNGTKGMNHVQFPNQRAGMYIVQITANNYQQSERIIKL